MVDLNSVSDLTIVSVNPHETGIEFLVTLESERRKGVSVAHSYFVEYESRWGAELRDLLEDVQELAWDVHVGWKREPKEETE